MITARREQELRLVRLLRVMEPRDLSTRASQMLRIVATWRALLSWMLWQALRWTHAIHVEQTECEACGRFIVNPLRYISLSRETYDRLGACAKLHGTTRRALLDAIVITGLDEAGAPI